MTIATPIASPISPRMNAPNWAPVMMVSSLVQYSSPPDRFESPRSFGERELGRQPLHARCAVEPVALRAVLQDVGRVLRTSDRAAVAYDDDVRVDFERGHRPRVDEGDAIL